MLIATTPGKEVEIIFANQAELNSFKAAWVRKIQIQGIPYRSQIRLGNVLVSFHSAGHILGSSQIRIEYENEVWVVSGDYKREFDPSCEAFEVVPCDTFITEATFGTPKFQWPKNQVHGQAIFEWWQSNSQEGLNSILFGYSLGKAQRILAELFHHFDRPVFIHSSMEELTECYRRAGRRLAATCDFTQLSPLCPLEGELILAPPSILKSEWLPLFGKYRTAFASGWMQGSSFFHLNSYDHGFVISDHADWNDLNATIHETGAKQVFVLHRSHGALVRHLRSKGIQAFPAETLTPSNYRQLNGSNLSLF